MQDQSRMISAIEALLSISSGFILALIVWQIMAKIYDIDMPLSRNIQITSVFTILSLLRSYMWRRLFTRYLNSWFNIKLYHKE